MGEAFTIQISSNLINRLTEDDEKPKKKARKPKSKMPRDSYQSQSKSIQQHHQLTTDGSTDMGVPPPTWPLQQPFIPVTASPQLNSEIEGIRSILRESERVVDRLEKHEEDMLKQVTQRAKELHEKEFKLPYQRPMPCLAEKDACLACYKEHMKDPLKCADVVRSFQDCARRARQERRSGEKVTG